ncbi:alpha/beta fold hydrolase [Lactiplantibacillus plantarum]|uniref:alpha/beta fold hydrolase n=1 Tax=Lactiplantibacillus plantarum TaxID=1590 RepID=UPI0009349EF3|nr:alpha/beta fold hydrolase [Lactiplantibacillus plantarum]
MQIKTNDGTILNVNKKGEGPVLILVPGANGTGDVFAQIAMVLADNFTVITYDRRGYGKTVVAETLPNSAANPDSNYRIDADVRDIFTLAGEFSPEQPIYIMGTSAGSIVAEKAFEEDPSRFAKIAIHETMLNTVINDDGKSRNQTNAIVQDALNGNPSAVSMLFSRMHVQPLDSQMMGLASDSKPDPDKMKSMMFWLKYETRQYTSQVIDWSLFKEHRDQVVLLNGTDSVGFLPQDVDNAISKIIDVPVDAIPGGHLGYVQKPQEFAQVLEDVLKR